MRAGSGNKSVFVFRRGEIPLKVGGLLVVEVGVELILCNVLYKEKLLTCAGF